MSLSLSVLKQAVDGVLRSAAGSAGVQDAITWEPLIVAAVTNPPLQESTDTDYGTPITVIAWVKVRPQGPEIPLSNIEMWRLGENINVDALFYVSRLQSEAVGLDLDVDTTRARIQHAGLYYDVQSVTPRSHVQGVPLYYRIAAVRGAAPA